MGYSISISGHKEADSETGAEEFEREIADKAAEFAQSLDGVTTANFYGGRVNRNLLEAAPSAQDEPVDEDSDQTQGRED